MKLFKIVALVAAVMMLAPSVPQASAQKRPVKKKISKAEEARIAAAKQDSIMAVESARRSADEARRAEDARRAAEESQRSSAPATSNPSMSAPSGSMPTMTAPAASTQDAAMSGPLGDVRKQGGGFARTQALGGSPLGNALAYDHNLFLQDVTFTLLNPAYVNVYTNYVWGNFDDVETGGGNRTFAGANFRVTEQLTLGLLVNTRDAQILANNNFYNVGSTAGTGAISGAGSPGLGTTSDVNNSIGGLIGFRATPDFLVGLQVYGAGRTSQFKVETSAANSNRTIDRSATAIGGDLGAVFLGAGFTAEGSVKVRINSASTKATDNNNVDPSQTGTSTEGGLELGVLARAFIDVSPTLKVVPVASFATFSWNRKDDTNPASTVANPEKTTFNTTAIEVGAGINLRPMNNVLIVGGASFVTSNFETKETNDGNISGNNNTTTDNTIVLPKFNFGLEYGVLDWLTLRLGYTRTNSAITNTAKTDIATPSSNSTTTTVNPNGVSGNSFGEYASFGTGFRIGDLNLDVSIANSFFKNGPWVVGGGSTSPLFGQMSAHFSF